MENLFGDSGLVNPESLSYFALLAAGGLVTGGSFAGSVRFAGAKAIENEMAQRKAQAAAQAELAKEQRAAASLTLKEIRQTTQSVRDSLDRFLDDPNLPPLFRDEIRLAMNREFDDPRQKLAYYQQLKTLVASKAQPKPEANTNRDGGAKSVSVNGRIVHNAQWDEAVGEHYVKDPIKGSKIYLPNSVPLSVINNNAQQVRNSSSTALKRYFISDKERGQADALAAIAESVYTDLGQDVKPGEFVRLVDRVVSKGYRDADAFEKAIYVEGLVRVADPTHKGQLIGKDITKPLTAEANNRIITAARQLGNGSIDEGAKKLVAKYNELPEEARKKWEEDAATKSRNEGQSGISLWLKSNPKLD